MPFLDLAITAPLLALAIVIRLADRLGMNSAWQRVLLAGANLGLLTTLVGMWVAGLYIGLALVVYLLARVREWLPQARLAGAPTTLGVGLTLAALALLNYPEIREALPGTTIEALKSKTDTLRFLGISYLSFRLISFAVDARRGLANGAGLGEFLLYVLWVPSMWLGPIGTFGHFRSRLESRAEQPARLQEAALRILWGVAKLTLLASLVQPWAMEPLRTTLTGSVSADLLLSGLAYYLYLYLNFSGSIDVALGTSLLFGLRLEENFRFPILATSVRDFWKRWHITLGAFLLSYVFLPFVRGVGGRAAWVPPALVTLAGYGVTFLLGGIWHGLTWSFVIWGLWHALGVALARFNPLARPLQNRPRTAKIGGILFTTVFVAIGWIPFRDSPEQLRHWWHLQQESDRAWHISAVRAEVQEGPDGHSGVLLHYDRLNSRALVEVEIRELFPYGWAPGWQNLTRVQSPEQTPLRIPLPGTNEAAAESSLPPGRYQVRIRAVQPVYGTPWVVTTFEIPER